MPFELKNVGSIYQKVVIKMLKSQFGMNIEMYINDMMIKTMQPINDFKDLQEVFRVIKEYGVRLTLRNEILELLLRCSLDILFKPMEL